MKGKARAALWGVGLIVIVLAAGYAAMLRPDIPWPRLDAKYANAASRWADMGGGVEVHYRDQGRRDGPPLVLVHGFGASLHAWEPWVARLGERYRIVTLDLPGQGLTRAPAGYDPSTDHGADLVDRLAQRLGLGAYVVGGNSMGGSVAWDDALRHGEHVRALVLVDSGGLPLPGEERRGGAPLIFQLLASPLGRLLIRDVDNRALVAAGLKDAYLDPALVTPALIDRYVELSRAPGHRALLLAETAHGPGPQTRATFERLRLPTLILHGRQDRLIPFAEATALAGAIPGARLIAYDGVGHVPMEQIPDRSAADLAAFLAGLPAAPQKPSPPPPSMSGR